MLRSPEIPAADTVCLRAARINCDYLVEKVDLLVTGRRYALSDAPGLRDVAPLRRMHLASAALLASLLELPKEKFLPDIIRSR